MLKAGASDALLRLIKWLNPITGSPSAPIETTAVIDSMAPSLMPRTSVHQGAAAGLSWLMARAVGGGVERATDAIVDPEARLSARLGARAAVGGVGLGLNSLPEDEDASMWRAGLRTGGRLLSAGSVGGAIYDLGTSLQRRYPAKGWIRPVVGSAAASAALLWYARRLVTEREKVIQRWPVEQRATIPAAVAVSNAVHMFGMGVARGYVASRNALIRYLGPGPGKRVIGRVGNAGVWAAGASALYNAGVGYVGRANEKVEPAYAMPPASEFVSGSKESLSPFEDLGLQGRRYVSDVVTPELIEDVLREPAKAHPIRTFVGYNSEPLYATGRAEMALDELERAGAFDRSYLLLVSPTGTGWVDQTMIESAEFLTRGDIATCCIQYGRYPSFLAVQKVSLGRSQFRLLLWGVRARLASVPKKRRPKVLVFGESLGAWTSSDVVMYQGIKGFEHYGIDRALWVGLPGLAKWSRNGMARGSSKLVPEGTVGVFDRHEQLAELDERARERLRAVILSHDNDPIAVLSPDLLIRKPPWLGSQRGRGVPEGMRWVPLITFWQTLIDAGNAMVTVPGKFGSFGHDYRADMAGVVRDAYHLPRVTDEKMERIEKALVTLELERAERVKAKRAEAAPLSPARRGPSAAEVAGVPLRVRRTGGARWLRSLLSGRGEAPADIR